MRSYKCDRCGELDQPTKLYPKFAVKQRKKKNNGDYSYDYIDLCQACYLEFVRFFFKGDKKKFEEEREDYCGIPAEPNDDDFFAQATDTFPNGF